MSQSTTHTANQGGDPSKVREMANSAAGTLAEGCRDCTEHYFTEPAKDLYTLAKDYAKQNPDVACCWAFGLGLFVGWKIKPW